MGCYDRSYHLSSAHCIMQGAGGSTVDHPDSLPDEERYNGLTNVSHCWEHVCLTYLSPRPPPTQLGNTCYANSVLQALYFCLPFRKQVLDYEHAEDQPENMLSALADLFSQMNSSKKKYGVIHTRKFIVRLKKENGECVGIAAVPSNSVCVCVCVCVGAAVFDNMQQQDAHEFLNYLLNTVADLLAGNTRSLPHSEVNHTLLLLLLFFFLPTAQQPAEQPGTPTWIHTIFQGTLVNETRCLCCETVRSKEEDFLDLSLDIDQNTSLTHCLR